MRRQDRLHPAIGGGAILILTLIAYAPSYSNGFVWDDDDYVTNNLALRSADGLVRIWTAPGAVPQYYPLTHTSFWIEWQLWRNNATGYHIVNTLLHALNAILLWRLLRRLKLPGAWAAGLIFAVHPMMVESVAWVTERKNVLSAMFALSSLHVYLRYQLMRDRRTAGRGGMYIAALCLFIAAMLSKTTAATLPAVALVLVWWKRGLLQWRDVRPLAPFFAIAVVMGLMTAWLEQHFVGAQGDSFDLTFAQRLLVAGRVCWFYPFKLLWPVDLAFIYPRWTIDASAAWQWLFPVTAAALPIALVACRRRINRGPAAAILIYGGMLFPAMGFFNVFPMRFSFVADHFCYLPAAALIALIATVLSRMRLVTGAIVVALIALTCQQTHIYESKRTIWADTVEKNPNAVIARVNYGIALTRDDELKTAQEHIEHALKIEPDNPRALNALGNIHRKTGRIDEAQRVYKQLVAAHPNRPAAKISLALLYYERNNGDPRVRELAEDVMRDLYPQALPPGLIGAVHANRPPPHAAEAHLLMGLVHANAGKDADAIEQFSKALVLRDNYADAHYQLGLALARQKQFDRAAHHLLRTLELNPKHPRAQRFLDAVRRQLQ